MRTLVIAILLLPMWSALAQDVKTFIPAKAYPLLPVLQTEAATQWPDFPRRAYFAALIEHESCIGLQHSRCWSSTSRLKSAREEGAGLGQITRAYRADGSLRFDALQEMRDRHPALQGLNWSNVYQRPELQMRAVILKTKDNFNALAMVPALNARLPFADAAYNGGLGGVQKERRACGLTKGCNPQVWHGNVELVCLKSRVALYGQRSACDINRHHVLDVIDNREPKYARWFNGQRKLPR